MIYSITLFLNEHDLIDLKIKEEHLYVDKIIVVESSWTHQGNRKSINFQADKYKDKNIEHLVVTDPSIYEGYDTKVDPHYRPHAERRYPFSVLPIADNDIVIISDCDEIINGENIPYVISQTRIHKFARMHMRMFYFYINTKIKDRWIHPAAAIASKWKYGNLQRIRDFSKDGVIINDCGNHFSYLGSSEEICRKIQSYSHPEFNTPEILNNIEKRKENLEDPLGRTSISLEKIEIDDLYPKTILNNLEYWKKYIRTY